MATENKARTKRLAIRDDIWTDADEVVWTHKTYKGFKSIPRLLPLICRVINQNKGKAKNNPTFVYLDLWCRVWDEGFIDRIDEEEFSYSSGYTGTRAIRTWREQIQLLVNLGFIRTERNGNREYGYILLIDPIQVCVNLRVLNKVDDDLWRAFSKVAVDYGTKLPNPKVAAELAKMQHGRKLN